MKNIKEIMLDKKKWAVVGITDNKDRYGYKIWKKLKEHEYMAYGVNPRLEKLEGEKIYNSVVDIEDDIDVLNMVVGPKIAMGVLDEAKQAGIKHIFFQPGSYDDEVVEKTKKLGLEYLIGDCIYATLRRIE